MDSALERLGNGCKEEDDRRKDEADDELHRGARTDKYAEADEEQLQTTGWSDSAGGGVRVVKTESRAFFPVSTISHQYIEGL